jgi:hypothetical protein
MSRQPLLIPIVCVWLFALIVIGGTCLIPLPPEHPRPTPTALIVLPTQTPFVFLTPDPTVTPRESVLAPTRTPGPTITRTPLPTATPTPARTPVQRGMR